MLLPVLVFAGAYAAYRLMRGEGARVPRTRPWGHQTNRAVNRLKFLGVSLPVALAIVAPGFLALWPEGLQRENRWFVGAFAIAVILALIAIGVRAHVTERALEGPEDAKASWSSYRLMLQMTALWAALAVPAAMIFWPASVKLQEAKVCTTSGFEEYGSLIGQTSTGVYLAEASPPPRRVATFTTALTEEVFIGPWAGNAHCDPRGLRGAVLASHGAAEARIALRKATQSRDDARRTTTTSARAEDIRMLADHVQKVAASAGEVARGADRTTPGVARPIWDAVKRAEDVAWSVRARERVYDRPEKVVVRDLLRVADEALVVARVAAKAAARGEKAIVGQVRASGR